MKVKKTSDGSRTAATCKMKRFMTIVNGWQPLNDKSSLKLKAH